MTDWIDAYIFAYTSFPECVCVYSHSMTYSRYSLFETQMVILKHIRYLLNTHTQLIEHSEGKLNTTYLLVREHFTIKHTILHSSIPEL